ncbi:MAG: DegT/DnrJ/EryC1/StrS family aminotransferase [bacterium]|nr:DegT/DnrJ/EryC1/StrS family aminotransferase [bacterium]
MYIPRYCPIDRLVSDRVRRTRSMPYPLDECPSKLRFYSHARYALDGAVAALELGPGDTVLLPAFVCPVVATPFRARNITVRFFEVSSRGTALIEDAIRKADASTKALVLVDYFGFPQPSQEEFGQFCTERGIWLIRNCAHAFLSTLDNTPVGVVGDLVVFSFRKTLGVPDGAALVLNRPGLTLSSHAYRYDVCWQLGGTTARLVQAVQSRLGVGPIKWEPRLSSFRPFHSAMSPLTRALLPRIDFQWVADQRRANFAAWLGLLGSSGPCRPLHGSLPEGVVPLVFPAVVDDPDLAVTVLRRAGSYAARMWRSLPDSASRVEFPEAAWLADRVVALPVHQGVSPRQIDALASLLRDRLGRSDRDG